MMKLVCLISNLILHKSIISTLWFPNKKKRPANTPHIDSTLSTPNLDVQNVEQVALSRPSLSIIVSDVFCEKASALNRERYERSLYMDDPDAVPLPLTDLVV